MNSFHLSIHGISSFSLFEDLNLLIQAGDGVATTFPLAKLYKIKHVIITNVESQFTAGLYNLLNLFQAFNVYYPENQLHLIDKIAGQFNHKTNIKWLPIKAGDSIELVKGFKATIIESRYWGVETLGVTVNEVRKKLKSEYATLETKDIVALKDKGIEIEHDVNYKNVFVYSVGTVEPFYLTEVPLWITGDNFSVPTRVRMGRENKVKQMLHILLERERWYQYFDCAYQETNGTEFSVPVPAVAIVNKFVFSHE
jgi:ribonuclease BN (tRNA processing enzyme)